MPATNNSQVFFTIGIPAYNAQDHLWTTLESAANQTFDDLEIILVNDGSTDRTEAIAHRFAEENSKIRVISKENEGPFLARRDIAKHANGKYLVFLDSDDKLAQDALQKCHNALLANNYPDVIVFDFSYNEDFTEPLSPIELTPKLYLRHDLEFIKKLICSGSLNQVCSKVIKRNLFDLENNYSHLRGFKHAEDFFQMLHIINNTHSLFYLNRCLYFYRRAGESGTLHYNPSQLSDLDITAKEVAYFGEKWNLPTEASLGILKQYCYILKITFMDKNVSRQKQHSVLDEVRKRILPYATPNALKKLSPTWKLLTSMILKNNAWGVRVLLFIKRHKR